MKKHTAIFIFLIALPVLLQCCKPKQKTVAETRAPNSPAPAAGRLVRGHVSLAYIGAGCGTAVIITDSVSGQEIILLPVTNMEGFAVDGLKIHFRYRPSKRKNPAGCRTGFPAELTDIGKE